MGLICDVNEVKLCRELHKFLTAPVNDRPTDELFRKNNL